MHCMKWLKTLLAIWLTTTLTLTFAQDKHFTLYDYSPMTLNPALSGAFEGTVRIGGIYRDQWASFVSDQYSTPTIYGDAPIISVRKRDWVGIGVMMMQDKAGTMELTESNFMLSAAYHLALDKRKGNTTLTLGAQGGFVQHEVNEDAGIFEDEHELGGNLGAGASEDRSAIPLMPVDYLDFRAGLLLKSKSDKGQNFEVGLSAGHVSQPTYAIISNNSRRDDNKRPLRFTAHGKMDIPLGKTKRRGRGKEATPNKWSLSPSFIIQNTAKTNEIILEGWTNYLLNKEKDITLRFGAGYRMADAGAILLGMKYGDLNVALAYDVNVSDLAVAGVSKYQGGFELAVNYIFKVFKKPDVKPVIICPDL